MDSGQITIVVILLATMSMFMWGRLRHDMIAMGALLACVLTGLVSSAEAFSGFGHPAVITVACVLVLSYGLQITGAVDVLARRILPSSAGPTLSILALTGLAALLSGFMNNVGALALLMPVAIKMAAKQKLPPARVLMPLAFGSILGGMTTLIGTPPNLIVSGFRAESGAQPFAMFDFLPVGLSVAVVGTLFVGLLGWHLVPPRKRSDMDSFATGSYLSEVRILEDSKAANKRLGEVEELLADTDAQIIGMVRNDLHLSAPNARRMLRAHDILVLEAEPEALSSALSILGLKLEEDVPTDEEADESEGESSEDEDGKGDKKKEAEDDDESPGSKEIVIQELVAMPHGRLAGRSATELGLRTSYSINLLAISRQGRRSIKRLRSTPMRAGDVLMMQGSPEAISEFAAEFGCLPLAARDIRVPRKKHALLASLLLGLAVAATTLGLVPVAIAFATAVLLYVVFGIIPVRSLYTAIDWPVIVLLGALLPVAGAMETTGAADTIARVLLVHVAQGHAIAGLVILLVATMFISDIMNNAATAAVMCPIAISSAAQFGVNSDSFLMAVAVGASCAFLTPIGHQSNTLILGPGGLRFGDYWRLGLPLEILVIAVSIPVLLWVWPL